MEFCLDRSYNQARLKMFKYRYVHAQHKTDSHYTTSTLVVACKRQQKLLFVKEANIDDEDIKITLMLPYSRKLMSRQLP